MRNNLVKKLAQSDHDQVFSGIDLEGVDLSGITIRCKLVNAKVKNAICNDTSFGIVEKCNMDGIRGRDTRFAYVSRSSFVRASIPEAKFMGVLSGSNFSYAQLPFSVFSSWDDEAVPCRPNRFISANLHGIDAAGMKFAKSTFASAILTSARLSRADLRDCDFAKCVLCGTNLCASFWSKSMLDSANFEGCFIDDKLARRISMRRVGKAHSVLDRIDRSAAMIGRLESMLRSWRDIDLSFEVAADGTQRHKILLWVDSIAAKAAGAVAIAPSGGVLRTYRWDRTRPLRHAMQDIAADYCNWMLLGESFEINLKTLGDSRAINKLAKQTISAVFAYVAPK